MNEDNLTTGEQDTEEHWISISDMMAGLMVIFLFIAISYMLYVNKQGEKKAEMLRRVKEIVEVYIMSQSVLQADLNREFEKDLAEWDAEFFEDPLTFRFKHPFPQGVFIIPVDFKEILDNFFPRYIKILRKYEDKIAEIRIEGHTSSEWHTSVSPNEAYILNMQLSQARTRNVLQHVLWIPTLRQSRGWLKQNLTANGLSSSKVIDANGKLVCETKLPEDREKSRRVEFRVQTNAAKQIVAIMNEVKGN